MNPDLSRATREIFAETLAALDAGAAVRRAVRRAGSRLIIEETEFDLAAQDIYAVAIGKAAVPMAQALAEILGDRIAAGVISAPTTGTSFAARWQVFAGGHPVPNEESLAAARASFALLARANDTRALVIFLISGGGSALLEWPRAASATLADLRAANGALVGCGASIAEINAVRRAFSAVKGGGLAARAPRAAQVSLIISDVPAGEEYAVASGPTMPPPAVAPDATEIIERYQLIARLPASLLRAIKQQRSGADTLQAEALRRHYLLLDNRHALRAAAAAARRRGFIAEIAEEIADQPIGEGCAALLARLADLRRRAPLGAVACLISGGEFACPARGRGIGGRNSEAALRCALEMADNHATEQLGGAAPRRVILSAGTDGIDGNSPAAGARADNLTLARAHALGLDAQSFLANSDAYTFFRLLGDAIITGPTGTNVRDVRIMLAGG